MRKHSVLVCLVAMLVAVGARVVDGDESAQRVLPEKLVVQIDLSSYTGNIATSPDAMRVAYSARISNKDVVVVDGKEGKRYDSIGQGTLVFSPDSSRVTYAAFAGNKQFVVIDRQEDKPYDGILQGTLVLVAPHLTVVTRTSVKYRKFTRPFPPPAAPLTVALSY